MRRLLTSLTALFLLVPQSRAQQEFILRHSLSEQFTVYGPQASPVRHFQSDLVPLDSALVAVSCQRIKQALTRKLEGAARIPLNFQARDEGRIFLVLHPKPGTPVAITPVPTTGPLNYRIDLPNRIEAPRFVDALTETLLLERVNRHARNSFTQIPLWLTQGLSAIVQQVAPETLVLEQHPPFTRVKTKLDPITEFRLSPTNFAVLTFDELSWPEVLSAEKAANYRQSAQLFIAELLRLKNGRASLRKMIDALPNHPKWQVAFLQAFGEHFQRLVDVEKWWALTVVNLNGISLNRSLNFEQSIESLDAALEVPVEIIQDFGSLPKRKNLSLQQVISDWEPQRQNPALEKVVSRLQALRFRIEPEMVSLLDDYRTALDHYLRNDDKNAFLRRALFQGSLDDLRQSTRQKLDALDLRRAQLRNRPRSKPSTREEAIRSALEIAAQRSGKNSSRQ